jgi:undecaprenyl-phosphate 4-deoxy-4-formamido-L-arabinose transferase
MARMPEDPRDGTPSEHDLAIVVPVYQGQRTLEALVGEVDPLTRPATTPGGRAFRVTELLLVHDGARDASASVMRALGEKHPFLRLIWLSRNFGQHPATLAGMASTAAEWVATLDEDGQQDPRDVGRLLDEALDHDALLVYAEPEDGPPHGALRNLASRATKALSAGLLGGRGIGAFNSFRLIRGDVARGVAAYCGANVYLDVALSWVVPDARHCRVKLRAERGRPSGYSPRRLLSHFWQLVLTSGTRPLRLIALLGGSAILLGLVISGWVLWGRLRHQVPVAGWTSMIIVVCVFSGFILFSLGIIAEYLGVAVSMAMGKPPYFIVARPSGQPPRD